MLRKAPHGGPLKGASRRGFGRLRQERSGRWSAAYTGPDAVLYRAPRTFDAKDDATAWLSAERRLIELGEWSSLAERRGQRNARGMTLATYSDRWLDDRVLKPRTREHYRSLLDRQILPELGPLPLAVITPAAVRQWHAGLGSRTPTLRAHAYGLLHHHGHRARRRVCQDKPLPRPRGRVDASREDDPTRHARRTRRDR